MAHEAFLPFHRPAVGQEEIDAVVETLRSGWLTMGPKTREFEETFAASIGTAHAVAVSSCTAALHLALDALGIGPGDEVLVPTLTFASTAATVIHVGARPVLVDCEPDTLTLDVADARRRLTPRTKAVVPVHFGGHPCDMDALMALAAEADLAVVEDAAHALPAAYRGRTVGAIGTCGAFSFYATKNLTTGEGGMLTTDDAALADRVRTRRLHGMTRDAWRRYTAEGSWRYDVAYPGFKANLTDVAAAMGLVQLGRLAQLQAARQAVVDAYHAGFADVPEVDRPVCRDGVDHAWHLYYIRLRPASLAARRDAVIEALRARGIGTSVHFIPLHEHSYYREHYGYGPEQFPAAAAEANRLISLPIYPDMTHADASRVIDAVRDSLAAVGG